MVEGASTNIVISGAKGGVGATTLVSNIAVQLSGLGAVLILDMDDICQGDAARAFGMQDSAKTFTDVKSNLNGSRSLIHGYLGTGIESVGLLNVEANDDPRQIIDKFSQFYSFILVDAGPRADEALRAILTASHKILLVSRADHSSIVAAANRCKVFKRMGISSDSVGVVINAFSQETALTRSAIEEKLLRDVEGLLPLDEEGMSDALLKGIPLSAAEGSYDFVNRLGKLSGGLKKISTGKPILAEVEKFVPDKAPDKVNAQSGLKEKVLEKLSSTKEIKKLISSGDVLGKNREFLEKKVKKAVNDILDGDDESEIKDRKAFIKDVIDEAIGLGPLEKFMAMPEITEIMVNAADEIYVEKAGKISKVDATVSSDKALMAIIERIVAPIGRRIDESSPIVDARLSDGSRVHVVIPPLSLKGPTITIRKFKKDVFQATNLIELGSLDEKIADFLKMCIEKRVNILVSGGTGSGKTTMLNILSSFIPEGERIVTIEDSAELRLAQPHVVRLESRPPNIEGKGEVAIRDLVKASLRMRPDRIIVGECRGAEALDMLQAMNTGHEGSLTTIHANSSRDSLSRLETLVMFAGFDLPIKAIREQITSAVDIIVQIKRLKDGSRKIVNISEVTGLEGQTITMQDLFVYQDGEFTSTGFRPKFLERS